MRYIGQRQRLLLFLAHHWFFSSLQIAAAVYLLWSVKHVLAPGYAVGALALLAAAMSVHTEMRGWQKVLWMLLIGGCLVLEFRAINHDRTQHDKEVAKTRQEENAKFERIAKGIELSIAKNQEHFDKTLARTNQVLDSVTGGSSYAVVLPATFGQNEEFPLMIENHGTNILTGVSVMISWQGAYAGKVPEFILQAINNRIDVGTIAPEERKWLNAKMRVNSLVDVGQKGEHILCAYVSVYAQNFTAEQYLFFKRQDSKWLFKYSVYRPLTKKERKIVIESKGKAMPNTRLEEIDWTDDLNRLHKIR